MSITLFFLKAKTNPSGGVPRYSLTEIMVYIFAASLVVNNIVWAGMYGQNELQYTENPGLCSASAEPAKNTAAHVVGYASAYLALAGYCLSRLA